MRWHHIIGLFASPHRRDLDLERLAFDGPRRLFLAWRRHSKAQNDRLSGMSLEAIAQAATSQAMTEVSPASSISFNAIASAISDRIWAGREASDCVSR